MIYYEKKIVKLFSFIIIILIFDFLISSFFLKKTSYWIDTDKKFFSKKDWRVESKIYHHDLAKNISVEENWGILNYKLITNSFGFRDFSNRKIDLINDNKKRIFINGDSFIEGIGYDYKDTIIGLLQKKKLDDYEFLNSAVTSYSPSIYYKKTEHYINEGLKFNYCFIFLDISDIPDENFIEQNDQGNIYDIKKNKNKTSIKGKIYKLSRNYRDNFTTGKTFAVLRELIGDYKSETKKKYLASKKFNKSFFNIQKDYVDLYKSTHRDRSMWTFDSKYSKKWKKKGLIKSDKYLKKLIYLLNEHKIKPFLIIYPNPAQIMFNKENINENYWVNWSEENKIDLVNLYKYFEGKNKKEIINKYFIDGDVHWNKEGHALVYNAILEEIFAKF